jgi:hypothetical protein
MGANLSSTIQKTTNDTLIDSLNQSMNSFVQNTKSSSTINQDLYFSAKGANINCKKIIITQSGKITTSTLSEMNSSAVSSLSNKVMNDLTAKLTEKLEQVNEGLNAFQANVSNTTNIVKNALDVNMKNIVENSITNEINSMAKSSQQGKIDFEGATITCGSGGEGEFIINQEAVINQATESIMANISETDAVTDTTNQIISDLVTDKSQLNKGIDLTALLLALFIPFIIFGILAYGGIKVIGKGANPTNWGVKPLIMFLVIFGIISIALIASGASKLNNMKDMKDIPEENISEVEKQNEEISKSGSPLLGIGICFLLVWLSILIFKLYKWKKQKI